MTTQIKPPEPAAFPIHPEPVAGWQEPPESAAVAPPESPLPAREKRKFTVAEYYRMAEVGILHHTERVELLDGEIIVMAPIGPLHAGDILRSIRLFSRRNDDRFTVQIQNPLRLDDGSEPEPDLMLLRPREDDYTTAHPTPADTLLVIETSDSSLAYDREVKIPLYARAGVPQTLIKNLPGDCIESFDQPGPEGYARHIIYRRGDKIRLVSLPDLELAVADLLPPRPDELPSPAA